MEVYLGLSLINKDKELIAFQKRVRAVPFLLSSAGTLWLQHLIKLVDS